MESFPFELTFRNRCSQIVWPAWLSELGLDNTEIETQLWLPLPSASERTVTAYGAVRDITLWGRTGCSYDQRGTGTCETGDCGGFVCNRLPTNATVFGTFRGFLEGYNLAMRVEGVACGEHECVADLGACSEASVVGNECGETVACSDTCSGSTTPCCREVSDACSNLGVRTGDGADTGDLVITFCP